MTKVAQTAYDDMVAELTKRIDKCADGFDKALRKIDYIEFFIDRYAPVRTSLQVNEYLRASLPKEEISRLDNHHMH